MSNKIWGLVIAGVIAIGAGLYYVYRGKAEIAAKGALPPRGTGLETGQAGARRTGEPRTEEERLARHYGV